MQEAMNRISFAVYLVLSVTTISLGCGREAAKRALSEELKRHLEIIQTGMPVLESNPIYNTDIITMLYDKGEAMLSARWEHMENMDQLLYAIRNSYLEGLRPEDYHLAELESLVNSIAESVDPAPSDIARLELLLSDAFLMLSAHKAGGKTDPVTIDPQWRAAGKAVNINWEEFIDTTLKNQRVLENLQKIAPRHREYLNLKQALSKYLEIKSRGGWERFTTHLPKLGLEMHDPDVVMLRERLEVTQGRIDFDPEDPELFDQSLLEHVKLFQRRNGLTADGVVGRGTKEALNISVEERIASIEANLERWRWLSEDLGERYIKVNIADFELQAIEKDRMVFQSEAIVGRPYRKTPVFSSLITFLVFNPDWTIPNTILINDVVPAVRNNPGYLADRRMKILRRDGTEVNPASIDWHNVTLGNFPYRIRQEPGPDNALGKVKFMFPNQYNVYIHDTPGRNLFSHTDRTFSSGCIRINKPVEFAEYLLRDNPVWTPAQIKSQLDHGQTRTVNLSEPVPVHILYLTVWADDDGLVYFRKDVYDRDQGLLKALRQTPPGANQ